jgi:hypothetical protein
MPHRESGVWAFGMIAGAITAVAANLHLFPWLPDDVKHYLSLVSFIIGVTCAKMAHSPQPSKQTQRHHESIDRAITAMRKRKR